MKKILIYFFLINIFNQRGTSQTIKNIGYEQISLDYFIDTILSDNYPNANKVYYKTELNLRLSLLRPPIEFLDYKLKKDSQEISELKREQNEIRSQNVKHLKLKAKNGNKGKLIQPLPMNTDEIDWDKSILIEVFRISIFKIGYYIDEIVIRNKTTRTYFFLEIDKERKIVSRWYKVLYVI